MLSRFKRIGMRYDNSSMVNKIAHQSLLSLDWLVCIISKASAGQFRSLDNSGDVCNGGAAFSFNIPWNEGYELLPSQKSLEMIGAAVFDSLSTWSGTIFFTSALVQKLQYAELRHGTGEFPVDHLYNTVSFQLPWMGTYPSGRWYCQIKWSHQ